MAQLNTKLSTKRPTYVLMVDENGNIVSPVAGGTVSTASIPTQVNSSASSAQLVAANTARRGLILQNTDANAAYIKYGTTASTTSFTAKIPGNGGYWEMPEPIYTGRIDVIWEADGSGVMAITEL